MKLNKLKAILGIELYKGRIAVVELRRAGAGAPEARRSIQAALALDPFSAAPELAGKEIRNLLDEAGMKTSQCVVCLPLSQPLVYQTRLPGIPEADVADFLNLEAERAFPFGPEDLVIAKTRYAAPGEDRSAVLLAMLATQTTALEKTLRAAGLKPVSITLGAAALADPNAAEPQAVISASGPAAELLIAGHGGFITLRTLGEFEEGAESGHPLDAVALAREARVTLGRLSAAVRAQIKTIHVYGNPSKCASLRAALTPEVTPFGLTLADGNPAGPIALAPGQAGALPPCATAAAAQVLAGVRSPAEFLVQQPHPFQVAMARFMARGMLWKAGAVAGALLLCIALAFGWQSWKINSLTNYWDSIKPQADQIDEIQQKVHTYRPWFDDDIRSLEIARGLTTAFPETGQVWTQDLNVKDMEGVTCRGQAQSRNDVMRVQENLRKVPGVEELQVPQITQAGSARGAASTVEFRLTYKWSEVHGHGE